jgi:ATP-binding cassette subfamily B protein
VVGRLALLRTVGWAPRGLVIGVVMLNLCLAVLPAAIAVAGGQVVASVPVGGAALAVSLVVLALVLTGDGILYHALDLADTQAARWIDGRVRREVRTVLGSLHRIDPAERPDVQDDVALATSTGGARGFEQSIGSGAGGQLAVWFRILGALLTAAVLVPLAWWLAVVLLGFTYLARREQQRRWASLAEGAGRDTAARRRTDYWTDLAAGADAAKELRVFGLGSWLVDRRRGEALGYLQNRWRERTAVMRQQWVAFVVLLAGALLSLGVPAWVAAQGRIGADEVVRYVLAGFALLSMSFVWQANAIEQAHVCLAGLERVRAAVRLQATDAATADGPTSDAATSDGSIRFEGVSFAYGDGPPVLRDIHVRLGPGEVVAVVGRNGAGKTTLVKLLAGLHAPTTGTVRLPVPEAAWRGQVAVLFQDFVRYPMTLAENVMLGASDQPDPDGVRRALRLAVADDLIETLPYGLDTVLSKEFERGVGLSGGQWQKVALARAVYAAQHGRRLLIMDEPTAHLDAQVETEFHDRVVRALSGVTIVMISHRLSTVRSADRIVLLEDGRIVEEGGHTELLAAAGPYATMFTLQASRFGGGVEQEVP